MTIFNSQGMGAIMQRSESRGSSIGAIGNQIVNIPKAPQPEPNPNEPMFGVRAAYKTERDAHTVVPTAQLHYSNTNQNPISHHNSVGLSHLMGPNTQ